MKGPAVYGGDTILALCKSSRPSGILEEPPVVVVLVVVVLVVVLVLACPYTCAWQAARTI